MLHFHVFFSRKHLFLVPKQKQNCNNNQITFKLKSKLCYVQVECFCYEWMSRFYVTFKLKSELMFIISTNYMYACISVYKLQFIICDIFRVIAKFHRKLGWWRHKNDHNSIKRNRKYIKFGFSFHSADSGSYMYMKDRQFAE